MKIYISIPITGHDYNTQMAKAKVWEDTIKGLGHTPVNPFSTPAHPSWMDDEQEQYAYYMGEDIKALLLCDAIYMEMGWINSKGCQLERQAAKIYGKKIFYSIVDIPRPNK